MEGCKFYVYIHTRLDTGQVFYVGKGKKKRHADRFGRNQYWRAVAEKAGWVSSIVQDGMQEGDAYLLEQWLIAKFRHNGVKLTNLTDGGEGGRCQASPRRKKTYCSNGMSFDSAKDAAIWLTENGHPRALSGHITDCCRGGRTRAYGYAWSYVGHVEDNKPTRSEAVSLANGKAVCCSNGMKFTNCVEAAKWLNSIGVNTRSTNISRAANGSDVDTSNGFSWWYEGAPIRKFIDPDLRKIPVKCSSGEIFPSLKSAAEWVSRFGKYPSAQGGLIRRCADGAYKTAYGYTWEYVK